jgi:hypothetical protein
MQVHASTGVTAQAASAAYESAPNGLDESRRNSCRLGNRRAYDNREGAKVKGTAHFVRIADMAFNDDRHAQEKNKLFHQFPVHGTVTSGFRCVAEHGGCHSTGSCLFGGERFVKRGNVGQNGFAETPRDAGEDLRPGRAGTGAMSAAVKADHIRAGVSNALGGCEVRRNERVSIFKFFENADDRKRNFPAERCNAVWSIGAETTGSSMSCRGGDTAQRISVVEGVAGACLAGNDKLIF